MEWSDWPAYVCFPTYLRYLDTLPTFQVDIALHFSLRVQLCYPRLSLLLNW